MNRKRVAQIPTRINVEFSDSLMTANAGLSCLAVLAQQWGLIVRLARAILLKCRCRGPRDDEMLISMILSLASGNG